MKKLLSAFLIIGFGLYVALQPQPNGAVSVVETPAPVTSTPPVAVAPASHPPVQPLPKPPVIETPIVPKRTYLDGVYTGDVADAYYGNLQVQVVIANDRITDVRFLQYPNDRRTSIAINTEAMPYLKQEAIAAQSARVNGVSGATASSRAFVESLASALAKAKA